MKKTDTREIIQNSINEHRTLRRLTQEELARRVGVSKQTIYMMEKGNYLPTLLLVYRLARVFETDIETLFIYKTEEIS